MKDKLSPQAIVAYNSCKTNWNKLASDSSDYNLHVILDHGTSCATALADAQIQDPVIAKGLEMYGWLYQL